MYLRSTVYCQPEKMSTGKSYMFFFLHCKWLFEHLTCCQQWKSTYVYLICWKNNCLKRCTHPRTHTQTMHWSFNGIMEMTTAKKAKEITLYIYGFRVELSAFHKQHWVTRFISFSLYFLWFYGFELTTSKHFKLLLNLLEVHWYEFKEWRSHPF